jgi:hypothetical protein
MRIIEIENLNVKKATIKESKAIIEKKKRGYPRGNCASRNTKGKKREN